MEYLRIEANRTCYGAQDVRRTMTVGELIALLEEFDEDTPVILSHDNGYTYGGITEADIELDYTEEGDDE